MAGLLHLRASEFSSFEIHGNFSIVGCFYRPLSSNTISALFWIHILSFLQHLAKDN